MQSNVRQRTQRWARQSMAAWRQWVLTRAGQNASLQRSDKGGIVSTLMLKQKYKIPKTNLLISRRVAVATLLVAALAMSTPLVPFVRADQYDAQIQSIQQDSNTANANLVQLGAEAASLQDQISKLQAQIDALQSQINANQAKSDDLKKQIAAAEIELAKQKKTLGENIRAMYLEGQISTVEMLASSKDLSDFVDKQQYRGVVQSKIKSTVDQITTLKIQLKTQSDQVEQLLRDQQNMQSQLAGSRAQQAQLLGANQQQQSDLNQKLQSNSTKIAELRAAQVAANAKLRGGSTVTAGDPGHGGYPARWDNAAQDTLVDDWGMYNRECVSYTAWKVFQTYGYMPYWGGRGNANQWPGDAVSDGIATGTTPRAHSVAIYSGGYYGHAMWVEGVSGNYIHVSQYNYDLAGHYSEMTIPATGLTFIYFQ